MYVYTAKYKPWNVKFMKLVKLLSIVITDIAGGRSPVTLSNRTLFSFSNNV